jgi:thimet oligopeptidase
MGVPVKNVSVLLSLTLLVCAPAVAQQHSIPQPPIWSNKPSAADFVKTEDAKLAAAESSIAALSKIQGPHTIENTVEPFDKAFMELDDAVNLAKLAREVHPDSAFRDKANEYVSKAESARKSLALNRSLYHALAAVDLSKADSATRYYVERRLQMFRWAGVDRSEAERTKLKDLQDELGSAQTSFIHNIDEDHPTLAVKPAELEGMPEDFFESHKPGPNGMVTLAPETDLDPVLKFAVSEDVRRRLFETAYNAGYPKNREVALQMLRLRFEIARLLGYSSWADYDAASKMTGNARAIENFITELDKVERPLAEREFPLLLAEKRKFNSAATDIYWHDLSFLTEQVRRQKYGVDSSALRAYLPVPAVKQGLLDISSKFFQVEFRKEENSLAWHPSVETWDVFDQGSMIGRIYLDLYARPGKANAWETLPLRDGKLSQQVPEAVLIVNLPNATAENPGLMEQEELDALFHEFGHAVHKILSGSRARWAGEHPGMSGTLEMDFLEAPSQFFEQFPGLPSLLTTFAHHYKTNEPIPTDLVNRLRSAAAFGRAMIGTGFNPLSALSLELHRRNPADIDLDAVLTEQNNRYSLLKMVPNTHFWASWSHLADYSSNYYVYDWDAMIVQDFFAQFDRNKPLAPELAMRYRKAVLEPGGSMSANDLVHNFLGRPQNFEAYRKWLQEEFELVPSSKRGTK